MTLIPHRLIHQMLANVLELSSKGLYHCSGKKKKVIVFCSRSQQNVNLGTFTLQSCQDGEEMYEKAWCTCKVVLLILTDYLYHRHHLCLSSLLYYTETSLYGSFNCSHFSQIFQDRRSTRWQPWNAGIHSSPYWATMWQNEAIALTSRHCKWFW